MDKILSSSSSSSSIPKKRIEQLLSNISEWIEMRNDIDGILRNTIYSYSNNHLSFCFSEKSKKNITPFVLGYNHCKIGKYGSIHAEIHALNKMFKSPTTGRTRYSLVVMRTNIQNSRPCFHCIQKLITLTGIRIRYVYYSMDKTFIRETLNELMDLDKVHISKYHRYGCKCV